MGGRGSSSGGGGGGGSAASAKMPKLSGSPKQIAWADEIRSSALANTDLLVKRAGEGPNGLNAITANMVTGEKVSKKSAETVRAEVVDTFQATTSASAIINARNQFTYSAIENLMKVEQRTGQVSEARKKRR